MFIVVITCLLLLVLVYVVVVYISGGASESEAEEAEGEVTLGQDLPGRGNIKQHQSSVRLYEVCYIAQPT